MRLSTVFKLMFAVLGGMLVTMFFLQNRGPVRVLLPFEHSFSFGLIYLVLIAYLLGVLSMAIAVVIIRKKYKKTRKLKDQKEAEELLDD